jgi:hypothetical protein
LRKFRPSRKPTLNKKMKRPTRVVGPIYIIGN